MIIHSFDIYFFGYASSVPSLAAHYIADFFFIPINHFWLPQDLDIIKISV
jgi:hypothetical protein